MKKIFLNTSGTVQSILMPVLTKLLWNEYIFILSEERAEYYICDGFSREYLENNSIRIFYTAENLSPDFNLFDFGIAHDDLHFLDRYLKYNYYLITPNFDRVTSMSFPGSKERLNLKNQKTEFCSFVYKDNVKFVASPERETFFKMLSEYKRVNSGGPFLNNINMPQGVPNKLDFDKKHKFSIAFENSSHPGYSTEKITDAFAAGCIPIYWGDPTIGEVFNERSFINCHRFANFQDVVKEIIRIDRDEGLYMDMLMESPLNSWKVKEEKEQSLREFFINIFEKPPEDARRRRMNSYAQKEENTLRYIREKTIKNNSRVWAYKIKEQAETEYFLMTSNSKGYITIDPEKMKRKNPVYIYDQPIQFRSEKYMRFREGDLVLFYRPVSKTWDINTIAAIDSNVVYLNTRVERLYEEVRMENVIGIASL